MNNTIKISSIDDALEITSKNIRKGKNTLITGNAGTGKSRFIKELKKLDGLPRLCLTAPTKLTANNIGGSTIHKTFHLPSRFYPCNIPRRFKNKRVTVIDEISMVGQKMFQQILDCSGEKSNFVLVGDFAQLPPVNDESLYPIFNSNHFDIEKLELITDYRHIDDPEFGKLLNIWRDNPKDDRVMRFRKSRTNILIPEITSLPDFSYIAAFNETVNTYNDYFDISMLMIKVRGISNRNTIKNNEVGIVLDVLPDGRLKVFVFKGG